MKFLFVTLFPEQIEQAASHSILQRAASKGLIEVSCINQRELTHDENRTEDDSPFGGGAGKVVITGKHECKSVVIDPSVVDPEDVEMLQDLIQLAFNSAQTRLSEISEERMRKEVPHPPGKKLPF